MTGKKREQLLDCAATLFRANGFRATGIDRILAASGCAKMTLYNHFGSKEELMLACVRRADRAWRTAVATEIELRSDDPRERLLALFDIAADIVGEDNFCGCFFLRAAHEFHDLDDPVHAAAADNKRLFTHYLTGLAAAAGAGEPEALAKSLLMLLDGAISYVHVCGDASAATLARRNAALLIDRYLA
jgi:AcrR family transcriptional regulator